MKLVTFYVVSIWDGLDGRSNKEVYFSNEEAASDWLKANTYDHKFKREYVVYDSPTDYVENSPESVKKRALAKLTPEERKALGFH